MSAGGCVAPLDQRNAGLRTRCVRQHTEDRIGSDCVGQEVAARTDGPLGAATRQAVMLLAGADRGCQTSPSLQDGLHIGRLEAPETILAAQKVTPATSTTLA